jgi:hypothetical protein
MKTTLTERVWPTGEMGDLVIAAGQTVQFPAGSVSDYDSITVQPGGTLEILPGTGWTIFGVTGDFTLKGTLIDRSHEHFGGSWTVNAPDGTLLSATLMQGDGGAGGDYLGCGNPHVLDQYAGAGGRPSASPYQGNGGGGGVCSTNGNGGEGTSTSGGNGGSPSNPPGELGPGGSGGSGFSASGQNGGSVSGGNLNIVHLGGGGGGGTRGRHGGLLYLCILGNLDAAGGTIDLSGEAGGAGGNGGSAARGSGAGGGGGGAGGDGGVLVLRYQTGFAPPRYVVAAGTGGPGGQGGADVFYGFRACPGGSGQNGTSGRLDIAEIPQSLSNLSS